MTKVHFELDPQKCSDPKVAAQWAWKCLEDVAAVFCEYYCDRTNCSMSSGTLTEITDIQLVHIEVERVAQWVEVQKHFHEALTYIPELYKISTSCPACSIVDAFSCFPMLIRRSPRKPIVTLKMNALDCYPEIGFQGRAQESSFPCVIIETLLSDIDTEVEERIREMALLKIVLKDLPPMPPKDLQEIKNRLIPGQGSVRSLYYLKLYAKSESEIEELNRRYHCNAAIVSVICLKELLHILYYFPDAIDHDYGMNLYKELIRQLEGSLTSDELKILKDAYSPPKYGDSLDLDSLNVLIGFLPLHHPDLDIGDGSSESASEGIQKLIQTSLEETTGPLKDIQNEIIDIKRWKCLIAQPKDDPSFKEQGRFVLLLEKYWIICKKVLSFQLSAYAYDPDMIQQLVLHLRKRIDICINELNSIDGISELQETLYQLLDISVCPEWDDLQLVPEWTEGELHKISSFISEISVTLKNREYDLIDEESKFIENSKNELDDYHNNIYKVHDKLLEKQHKNGGTQFFDGESSSSEPSNSTPENSIVIDRKEIDGKVHWFVNDKNRGCFYKRKNTKRAKILEILYEEIGRGPIPHKTFMNQTGWSEEEYFRAYENPGRMQRTLSEIRSFFDVPIHFDKEKGVCFHKSVVKSE